MKKFDYKKSLGQNFLIDKNIITKILNSIEVEKDDLIIEIGPGSGALTRKLIEKNCDVMCFEIDERLKDILLNIESNNLNVVFSDFLKVDLNKYIDSNKYKRIHFVGNLPYYITTAIINKIIVESNPYEIVIMVQKEVGERFMAKPNTKQYNSLSVFLQYNFNIKKVCDVSKACFEPIPKVDSVVIRMEKNNRKDAQNLEKFYKLIKDAFTQKRKNLRNNLKNYDLEIINNVLSKHDKDLTYRAEALSIDEFVEISNNI